MREIIERIDTKMMIIIGGIFVGIIFVFYLLGSLFSNVFRKYDYSDIESVMKNSAVKYYNSNKSDLPKEINSSVEVSVNELVDGKYMKKLSKYVKNKNIVCDGKVVVTNINGNYRYAPSLDCGDDYKTKTLADFIKNTGSVVTSGNGLYEVGNNYIYRGDDVDNYALLNNNKYRIIKIENDYVVMVYFEKIDNLAWDNRYNIDKKTTTGINDFTKSRAYEYLTKFYEGDEYFTENDKLMLASHELYIGKRKISDTDKTNSVESSKKMSSQYVGLITLSDFMMASLDSNCKASNSVSCINYNYFMDYSGLLWTATADAETSFKVFRIERNSGPTLVNASSTGKLLPVVYLAKDVLYVSGDGSLENPYTFK